MVFQEQRLLLFLACRCHLQQSIESVKALQGPCEHKGKSFSDAFIARDNYSYPQQDHQQPDAPYP
eukprot:753098-Hanusia_phi.AAC.1